MKKKFILMAVLLVATASSESFSQFAPHSQQAACSLQDYSDKAQQCHPRTENQNTSAISYFTEAAAIKVIFSEYNEEHRGTLIPRQLTSQWDLAHAQALIKPILTAIYEEGGQMKAVVVTARREVRDGKLVSGSMGEGAPISVYVFVRKGEHWLLETEKENVIKSGRYAEPPSYRQLIRIGNNKYGIQFHTWNDAWIGNGKTVSSSGRILIGISDGVIAPLANFRTGENNAMSCAKDAESQDEIEQDECWSYKGKLTFLRRKEEDYYFAKISYKGSERVPDGSIKNVDRDEFYVKGENQFRQISENDSRIFGKGGDEVEPVSEAKRNIAPLPISTTTGPSFDCGGGLDAVERYICRSRESVLPKLDRDLGMRYQALMQMLPPAEAAWLAQSHYNWLENRSKCQDETRCLEQGYRSRLDELVLDVVDNPIEKEQLPYRFVTPASGKLVVESHQEMQGSKKQRLVYRNVNGEQELWSSEQGSYAESTARVEQTFKGVSLITLGGSRLILVVKAGVAGETGDTSVERRYYYAFTESDGFVLQGSMHDEMTDSSEIGHSITTRWVKGDESPLLESTERYWDHTGGSSKLLARTRLYRFSFDGRPWREQIPIAEGNLPDNAGGAKRVMASVLNKETAMLGVFGAYNSKEQGTLIPLLLTSQWDVDHAETLARPIFVKAYDEGGQQKGVVVIQRQKLNGGTLSPSVTDLSNVSVYTFKRTEDLWILDGGNAEIGQLDSNGLNSGDVELVALGKDKHGIVLNWTGGDGRSGARHAAVIDLAGGAATVLGSYIIEDNNAASCVVATAESEVDGTEECWGYNGELSFANAGEDYYVLKLSYDGTALVDGNLQRKDEPLYYRKGEHGYENISVEQGAAAVLLSESEGDEELGFGFDCAQPLGDLGKRVCEADDDKLRVLSEELADKYRGLQETLTDEQSDWLRDTQREWAAELPEVWEYQHRIQELGLGMAVTTKERVFEDFSYQVPLPNGLDGKFQYVQNSGLSFIGIDGRQLRVWDADVPPVDLPDNARFVAQNLEELSIIVLRADQVVLDLGTRVTAEGIGQRQYHYFFAFDGNRFAPQGVIATLTELRAMDTKWVAGDDGPWLQVRSLSSNPFEILDPTAGQWLYRLRFDGHPWQEVLPSPQRWIHEPDGAAHYHTLYDDIVAELDRPEIDGDMCTESGIRWTLANASLGDWLDLVLRARESGVRYGDAAVIIAQVLSAGERPALTERQRELFLALDYIRRQQEATDGWWGRLDRLAAEAETSSVDFELMERHGITRIENECMTSDTPYGDLLPDLWYNTFWIRRHLDGTYDVAKQVIDYALDLQPEFPLDQAPGTGVETTNEISNEAGEKIEEETGGGMVGSLIGNIYDGMKQAIEQLRH